jgi:hypothetical protein
MSRQLLDGAIVGRAARAMSFWPKAAVAPKEIEQPGRLGPVNAGPFLVSVLNRAIHLAA